MGTTGHLLLLFLLVLGGAGTAQEPPILAADVQQLLVREQRTTAMQRLIRGPYRGAGTYTEKKVESVRHVVVCPQPSGPPMFAVFCGDQFNKTPHVPLGHLILVAADGAIVRVRIGNNLVNGVFRDVTGDGVIDRIDSLSYQVSGPRTTVDELIVRSMTEEQTPMLRVAFQPDDVKKPWSWRLIETPGKPPSIELGPRKEAVPGAKGADQLEHVAARWTWSPERRAWLGPAGAPDQEFVVLPPAGDDDLRNEFAENPRRRQR